MAYEKLKSIPSDYETFSDHYDRVYAASSRRGLNQDQLKKLGIQIAVSGQYMPRDENALSNRLAQQGYDSRRDFDPTNAFDPRYAGPANRRYTPDIPHPEQELRQDDPRYNRRRTPKPGVSF